MRVILMLALCTVLAGCAGGGSAADRARNDHDLGPLEGAGLALASQARTDANDVDDLRRRAAAATP